jgi:hypothetical protein
MPETMSDWLIRLLPPITIIGTVLVNRVLLQQWRHRSDAAAVIKALQMELIALRELYEANLRSIGSEKTPLLSTRTGTSFYRANLGRITSLLDRETLTPVMAAFTYNENVEAYRAAIAQSTKRRASRSQLDEALFAETKEKCLVGIEQIRLALLALEALSQRRESKGHFSRFSSQEDAGVHEAVNAR